MTDILKVSAPSLDIPNIDALLTSSKDELWYARRYKDLHPDAVFRLEMAERLIETVETLRAEIAALRPPPAINPMDAD